MAKDSQSTMIIQSKKVLPLRRLSLPNVNKKKYEPNASEQDDSINRCEVKETRDQETDCTTISYEDKNSSTKDHVIWLCDYCQVAKFETHEKAVAHELKCRHRCPNGTSILLSATQGTEIKRLSSKQEHKGPKTTTTTTTNNDGESKRRSRYKSFKKAVRSVVTKNKKNKNRYAMLDTTCDDDSSTSSWKRSLHSACSLPSVCSTEVTSKLSSIIEDHSPFTRRLKSSSVSIVEVDEERDEATNHAMKRNDYIHYESEMQLPQNGKVVNQNTSQSNSSVTIKESTQKKTQMTSHRNSNVIIKESTPDGLQPRLSIDEMASRLKVKHSRALKHIRKRASRSTKTNSSNLCYFSAAARCQLPDHFQSHVARKMDIFYKSIGLLPKNGKRKTITN